MNTLAILKSTDVGPGEIVLLRKCCTQGRRPRPELSKQINKNLSPEARHAGAYCNLSTREVVVVGGWDEPDQH